MREDACDFLAGTDRKLHQRIGAGPVSVGLARRLFALGIMTVATLPMVWGQSFGGGLTVIEEGQPPIMIMPTLTGAAGAHQAATSAVGAVSTAKDVSYHAGGQSEGVEIAPKIYLVFWGSQWKSDPSGEAAILESFYKGVGGSSWLDTVTQYCEGVGSGTVNCKGTSGTPAGNQLGMFVNFWYDNATAAPLHPSETQLITEVENAAQHFFNTSAAINMNAQYVIATPTHISPAGFGSQYCAFHNIDPESPFGTITYTLLPYITDVGPTCGGNFNNLRRTANHPR
jgi:serine protease